MISRPAADDLKPLHISLVAEDFCAVVDGEALGRLGRVGELVDAGRDVVLESVASVSDDPVVSLAHVDG